MLTFTIWRWNVSRIVTQKHHGTVAGYPELSIRACRAIIPSFYEGAHGYSFARTCVESVQCDTLCVTNIRVCIPKRVRKSCTCKRCIHLVSRIKWELGSRHALYLFASYWPLGSCFINTWIVMSFSSRTDSLVKLAASPLRSKNVPCTSTNGHQWYCQQFYIYVFHRRCSIERGAEHGE